MSLITRCLYYCPKLKKGLLVINLIFKYSVFSVNLQKINLTNIIFILYHILFMYYNTTN